jgi:hypothetical protein
MKHHGTSSPYCSPERLAYSTFLWPFDKGEPFTFDDNYRLAHLPLVARSHPAVIASVEHLDYRWGRYAVARHSLVAPVDAAILASSPAFQAIDADVRGRSFAHKIAWDMLSQRASKLHVTVAGGLRSSEIDASAAAVARAMAGWTALRYRLGGPFVGSKNRGRIYLTAYPEAVDGDDVFALLQDALGVPRTKFYVLGYYNLSDELDPEEAADLADLLATWKDVTVAELAAVHLDILATHDDLALDSEVIRRIPAGVAGQ